MNKLHAAASAISLAGAMLTCSFVISSSGALAKTVTNATQRAPHRRAYQARAIRASDEAHLLYVRDRSAGSRLFEEGTAHGTLPGKVRTECELGAIFLATVTISTNQGIIRGHGAAKPHASGIYESFSGTLTITGGTGRYAHARGHAGLYGLFNRRTYNLTVQTTGTLTY